jgi:hypothetical protein
MTADMIGPLAWICGPSAYDVPRPSQLPPVWMWIDEDVNKSSRGEVGTLVEVQVSQRQANRCFLVIEYEDSQYMGCLHFDVRASVDGCVICWANTVAIACRKLAR